MGRFPFRGASAHRSLRGFARAAARNAPPNVKRWRREAIEAARAAALDTYLQGQRIDNAVETADKTATKKTKEEP